METTQDYSKVLNDVTVVLSAAKDYNIEAEVFTTIIVFLKENPNRSINDALNYGINEWIK